MLNISKWPVAGMLCFLWIAGACCGSGTALVTGQRDTPEAAYSRGMRLMKAGSYAGAAAAFDHARALDPNYAPAYEGLSRAALAGGKTDEAIRHIRIAKSKDAAYAPVWTVTGMLYTAAKRYQIAITEYEEALRLDPDRLWATETYYALGKTYEEMGKLEQAHDAFISVIALDPLHLEARAGIGRTRQALGPVFLTRLQHEGKTEILP